MKNKINYMNIKEFREKGYLQELNRQFLHPLGLALEVEIKENGEEILKDLWDYREDPLGIYYDLSNSNLERLENFQRKANFVKREFEKRQQERINKFNSCVEPIFCNRENK